MSDHLLDMLWQPTGIAIRNAFANIMLQRLLGIHSRDDSFFGIVVAQLYQAEVTANDDLHCPGGRLRVLPENAFHFLRRFKEPVGLALALEDEVIDCRFGSDAGDDVLELTAARLVEQSIVCDDRLHPVASSYARNFVQPQLVVWSSAQAQ